MHDQIMTIRMLLNVHLHCRAVATKLEVVQLNYSTVAMLGGSGGMPPPQENIEI